MVYSWLWFEGEQSMTETGPNHQQMSESAALQTASYLANS